MLTLILNKLLSVHAEKVDKKLVFGLFVLFWTDIKQYLPSFGGYLVRIVYIFLCIRIVDTLLCCQMLSNAPHWFRSGACCYAMVFTR